MAYSLFGDGMGIPRDFDNARQPRSPRWRRAMFVVWVVVGCGGRVEAQKTEAGFGGKAGGAMGGAATGGNAGTVVGTDCVRPEQWTDLPDCAYVDGCRFPAGPYVPCALSGDCTLVFEDAVPNMPLYHLFLCGQTYDARPDDPEGDWTFSADRTSVVLDNALCQRVQSAQHPQLVLRSVHSCIL